MMASLSIEGGSWETRIPIQRRILVTTRAGTRWVGFRIKYN